MSLKLQRGALSLRRQTDAEMACETVPVCPSSWLPFYSVKGWWILLPSFWICWGSAIEPQSKLGGSLSCSRLRLGKIMSWPLCTVVSSLSPVQLFVTPWTVACQAPLSMGFPRQECWSGFPFPSPVALPDPGFEPLSPALPGKLFTTEPPGKTK